MEQWFLEGRWFGLGVFGFAIAAAIILALAFAFIAMTKPHFFRLTVFGIFKLEVRGRPEIRTPRVAGIGKSQKTESKKLEDA